MLIVLHHMKSKCVCRPGQIKQLFTDYQGRGVAVVVIMGNDPKAEELSNTDTPM